MISTLSVNMYAEETTKPIIEEEILQADPASPVQRGNTVTYLSLIHI